VKRVKKVWKTIKVPEGVKARIDRLKKKYNKVAWEVVFEAVSIYETILAKPKYKNSLPLLEKVAWYITKLSLAYGSFRENTTLENLENLARRVREVENRLGVNGQEFLRISERYYIVKDPLIREELKPTLNSEFKTLIKDMILKALADENQEIYELVDALARTSS